MKWYTSDDVWAMIRERLAEESPADRDSVLAFPMNAQGRIQALTVKGKSSRAVKRVPMEEVWQMIRDGVGAEYPTLRERDMDLAVVERQFIGLIVAERNEDINKLEPPSQAKRRTADPPKGSVRSASEVDQKAVVVRQLRSALTRRDSLGQMVRSDEAQAMLKVLEFELRVALQILVPEDLNNSERLGRIASGS